MAGLSKYQEQHLELTARLQHLQNQHQGKAAAIVCPGPSLENVDTYWLRRIPITFCVNAAYRLFRDRLETQPTYSVSIDDKFWMGHPDALQFLEGENRWWIWQQNLAKKDTWKGIADYAPNTTNYRLICDGSSAHAALHLALISGASPIYLLGIDLSLSPRGEVYYTREETPQRPARTHKQAMGTMHGGFEFLASLAEPGRVWDCSPDGQLTAFAKVIAWN